MYKQSSYRSAHNKRKHLSNRQYFDRKKEITEIEDINEIRNMRSESEKDKDPRNQDPRKVCDEVNILCLFFLRYIKYRIWKIFSLIVTVVFIFFDYIYSISS